MKRISHLLLIGLLFVCSHAMAQQEITESTDQLEEYYIDDIVQRTLMFDSGVLPYEAVREADVAWSKKIWRVIDVREKMNLPFQYPGMPLFQVLKDMVENGDAKAFSQDDFKEDILPEDIKSIVNRLDTLVYFNEDTYEEEIKIVQNDINAADISRYRVKEIWYFDEEASAMKVRILGIAPIKDEFDPDTGEFKYSLPLFWVYYPEARESLGKQTVFNEFNDHGINSWADIFDTRFFASYIYKESNTLDLPLRNIYDDGIEKLLESEKIKAELFNFEHDLWEY